jgi:membrane protease YdiL (CAAX protease family)
MPRWPAPVMIIGGAVLGLGAVGASALESQGRLETDLAILGPLALLGAALFAAGLVYAAVRQIRMRSFLPPERYRGPGVLILLALALVIATVLTAPFGEDAAALLGEGDITLIGALVLLVSLQVALLFVAWLFVYRPRALAALPAFPGPDPWRTVVTSIGWGLAAWVGSTAAAAAWAGLLDLIGEPPDPQPAAVAIEFLDPWLIVLAVVILAPLAEEVFFRGVVYNAWLREAGRRWAFFGSSALFAAVHLSLVSLVPIFLLGLALAWVYERSRSLLAPIVMHATVNGVSVALVLLARSDVIRPPV